MTTQSSPSYRSATNGQTFLRRASIALVACASFLGCAAGSTQLVQMPDLAASVRPGAARAVVIRIEQVIGGDLAIIVYDGEREIGRLGRGHYLAWEHAPGRMLLRLVFDRPALDGGPLESLVDYVSGEGATTYYKVGLRSSPERRAFGKTPGAPVATRLESAEGSALLEKSEAASYDG